MADLLLLAMAHLSGGLTIAGMTTEPDPVTKLRWVRPVSGAALALDELRYEDGTVARLGDVLRLDLGDPQPQEPHVENVQLLGGTNPATKVRSLTEARRSAFFVAHLDPEPRAVLSRTPTRSLCLVQPDDFTASFTLDEETDQLEARLVLNIGTLRAPDPGVLVTDVYWRAMGREWLRLQDEPFAEYTAPEVRAQLGDVFVVISLNRKRAPVIAGVHSIKPYPIDLDEQQL